MIRLLALVVMLAASVPARAQDAAALFDRGVTWDAFLTDVQSQRDKWTTNAGRATVDADLVQRFKHVAPGLKILVVAEASCSDSVNTIPYLAKLASLAGVELRIVNKATGAPVIEHHLTPDGRTATPTVILLRDGKEAGAWVERPALLQAWHMSMAALDSDERLKRKLSWYDWDRGATTLAEIVALAEK
ncbi:MAG TPA: thioredoxin family protein [Vicinamibacterales bacterium]|nr:thioredoxin family protein [Vicinamibacterales bacterium]